MPDRYVIDAGVVSLYFSGNPQVKKYFDDIFQGKVTGYVCELNIAEFQYNCARALGLEVAAIRTRWLRNSAILVEGIDAELTDEAARIKVAHNEFSLADCYLIAFGRRYGGTILTTDGRVSKNGITPAVLIPVPRR